MDQKNLKHRHFIVAPLVATVLLCSMGFSSLTQTRASLLNDADVLQEEQQANAVEVLALDGAKIDTAGAFPRVEWGSALVTSEGVSTVRAGKAVLMGLHGGYHVSVHGSSISVAALTSPVLVYQEDDYVLVPIGRQWRSGTEVFQTLPQSFYREQLRTLGTIDISAGSLVSSLGFSLADHAPASLQLPEARNRSYEHTIQSEWNALVQAVESQDPLRAHESMAALTQMGAFVSSESQQKLSILLTRSQNAAVAQPIMQQLMQDERYVLLTALHPRFAVQAWLTMPSVLSDQVVASLAYSFASAESSHASLGELAASRFGMTLERWLARADDPVAFIEAYMVQWHEGALALQKAGYPERARRFVEVIAHTVEPYTSELSRGEHALYRHLVSFDAVSLVAEISAPVAVVEEVVVETEEIEEESAPPSITQGQAEGIIYTVFGQKGALYTLETRVKVLDSFTLQVTDLIFSSRTHDRSFDFIYNRETGEVSQVTEDGKTYPYDLAAEDFIRWASS